LTKRGINCQRYKKNWQRYELRADHSTSWTKMVRVDRIPLKQWH